MIELVISVCAVIVVSAMCSLFEAVLYSVPVSYVESLAQNGTVSGRILKDLRMRNVDRSISAILSLNTIANTGGAFVAGAAFVKVFGGQSEHYFTIFITLSVLVLSEVIPKTVGVVYSRSLAEICRDSPPVSGLGSIPPCGDVPAGDPGVFKGWGKPGGLRGRDHRYGAYGPADRGHTAG